MTRRHHPAGSGEHSYPDSESEVLEQGDDPESRFERGRTAQAELFGGAGGRTRRSVLVLITVLALVVGGAAGAYLWNGRVERTHEDAARARVSLGATLASTVNQTAENQFEIDYTNYGPYALTIGTVTFDEFALTATVASTGIEIAPGKSASQKISIKVDCTAVGNPEMWAPATTATVALTTADGVDRTTKVNLLTGDLRDAPLSYLAQSACGAEYLSFGDLYVHVDSAEAKDDAVVSHLVVSNPFEGSEASPPSAGEISSIVLNSLYVGGNAYVVSTELALPAELPPDGQFDVIWKVVDCTRARQAIAEDLDLHLHGSVNEKSQGEVEIYPDPSLVAQLVRLAFTTCGTPSG